MDNSTPEPPTHVRVVDNLSREETPLDLVYEGRDDDGLAVWRVVSLPSWFQPGVHTIAAETVPAHTSIVVPAPN